MGLPQINIEFNGKAVTAIKRSALGVVALILRDTTAAAINSIVTIKSIEDIKTSDWTDPNLDFINKTLLGEPSKVIVLKVGAELDDSLTKLGSIKFNYCAMPTATEEENALLVTWFKSKRNADKKTNKYVTAKTTADHEGIINFTTEGIKVGNKPYTTQEYTSRIAGILAGLPFTRSATFYELPEVTEIEDHEDPDGAIDDGELILINDGEKIKIGRGVNSLTTFTIDKTADFAKIKIVEVMDMILDDIRDTFNANYVGKVQNTYDNQVLFFTSTNAYFKGLAADEILDPNFENVAGVNVEAQRLAWDSIGTDTTDWDEQQVKNMSFKSNVFAAGNIKIVDAMEDIDFQISI